jgi:hypothetical protein
MRFSERFMYRETMNMRTLVAPERLPSRAFPSKKASLIAINGVFF